MNKATATGDGAELNLLYPQLAVACQAEIFGSPSTCVINVMGLIDGATYDTLAVLDVSQGYISGEIVMFPIPTMVRKLKGNIGSLSGGNSPGVSPSVSLYVVTSML